MNSWVPPEVNAPEPGNILLVGRDPGSNEMRAGRPFVGRAGQKLDACLGKAGLRRGDLNIANVVGVQPEGNNFRAHSQEAVETGVQALHTLVRELEPSVIVCLGNVANYAFLGKGELPVPWESSDGTIFGAKGVLERRGYFHSTPCGVVLSTVHPSALLRYGSNAAIAEMLFIYDLSRAKEFHQEGAKLPSPPEVTVVNTPETALTAVRRCSEAPVVGCDLENFEDLSVACIGFAVSPQEVYVFPPPFLETAFEIVSDPSNSFVFHNGKYDCYVLRKLGVEVPGFDHDTMLQFHTAWPEIAGSSESGNKRTEKSLRFLGSLYSFAPFWKDYAFESEFERYVLNGYDCCVTLEAHEALKTEFEHLEIDPTVYNHGMAMNEVVMSILERGILLDNEKRERNLDTIMSRLESVVEKTVDLAEPLLESRREAVEREHLFWTEVTCFCCRNGSKKLAQCWQCAGFEKSPSKKALVKRWFSLNGLSHDPSEDPRKRLKADLEEELLNTCEVCSGEGKWEVFDFNPNSDDQKVELLFNVLSLPPRYKDGHLSVAEDKLKSLLGVLT